MGPLSSPDGAVLEIIGNRKELKHSIGGELHGASTTSSGFDMWLRSQSLHSPGADGVATQFLGQRAVVRSREIFLS